MTKRRENYDSNLPRNLTYRQSRKTFAWRNPITGKEISLGNISKREAIAQAIEANHYLEQNYSPVTLLEQLKGEHEYTVAEWLKEYWEILGKRELSAITLKSRKGHLEVIRQSLGEMVLAKVSTLHIADFLKRWTDEDKMTMATTYRSVLSDVFREAIVNGRVATNPVEPTRTPTIKVKRERLELETYAQVRQEAEALPVWFRNGMDLALVTGQRREDIVEMRFSEIRDNRLHVVHIKTGMMIAISLDLELRCAGLVLGDVIERCRKGNSTDFLISAGVRKNSLAGSIHPDGLTKYFVKARKLSQIVFSESPPTFHEIRSLAGRMHEAEYSEIHGKKEGKAFAQRLLGHTSEATTKKYLDPRKKEFILV